MAKTRSETAKAFDRRKRRTREHILADLGVNHFERAVLQCGHVPEIVRHDYGIDMLVWFYDAKGYPCNGLVMVQVKSRMRVRRSGPGAPAICRVERRDLEYWLAAKEPVILVLYDATYEHAYWLYVQAHFEALPRFQLSKVGETLTVHIPGQNRITTSAIGQIKQFNDDVEAQIRGKVRHHVQAPNFPYRIVHSENPGLRASDD